jgi:osmotically-inducible protein OsmY
MSVSKLFQLMGVSILFVAGLAACDKPGPAETAGKKIDQTAQAAGKKIEQTAEAAGRKINDATDKMGDKLGEQGLKTGIAINDSEITAKIKAAYFAEPGLKSLQISVDTVKGDVTLSGSVDSKLSSDRAKELAGAVAGVSHVDNRLVAKATGSK